MKAILIAFTLLTGCGMMQPVQDHVTYLHTVFPNSRIIELDEMGMIYIVTDTLRCKTYIVNMDEWKRNYINKIKE